jgi:hypothetical protein
MPTRYDHNLFNLRRQLEMKTGKVYKLQDIEKLSGVHRNTLANLSKNATRRIDLDIAARLVDFFNSQGMEITLADLFTLTPSPPHPGG